MPRKNSVFADVRRFGQANPMLKNIVKQAANNIIDEVLPNGQQQQVVYVSGEDRDRVARRITETTARRLEALHKDTFSKRQAWRSVIEGGICYQQRDNVAGNYCCTALCLPCWVYAPFYEEFGFQNGVGFYLYPLVAPCQRQALFRDLGASYVPGLCAATCSVYCCCCCAYAQERRAYEIWKSAGKPTIYDSIAPVIVSRKYPFANYHIEQLSRVAVDPMPFELLMEEPIDPVQGIRNKYHEEEVAKLRFLISNEFCFDLCCNRWGYLSYYAPFIVAPCTVYTAKNELNGSGSCGECCCQMCCYPCCAHEIRNGILSTVGLPTEPCFDAWCKQMCCWACATTQGCHAYEYWVKSRRVLTDASVLHIV